MGGRGGGVVQTWADCESSLFRFVCLCLSVFVVHVFFALLCLILPPFSVSPCPPSVPLPLLLSVDSSQPLSFLVFAFFLWLSFILCCLSASLSLKLCPSSSLFLSLLPSLSLSPSRSSFSFCSLFLCQSLSPSFFIFMYFVLSSALHLFSYSPSFSIYVSVSLPLFVSPSLLFPVSLYLSDSLFSPKFIYDYNREQTQSKCSHNLIIKSNLKNKISNTLCH